MIEIQKKHWNNDNPPYLDEDLLNDNQKALEAVSEVCTELGGQLND